MPLVIKKMKGIERSSRAYPMFKMCEARSKVEPKTKSNGVRRALPHCYSKKPLTKEVAIKQRIAINLSKLGKKGKILPRKKV